MNPRTYRVFLPLFLAFYGVAGFLTHSRFSGREIFPLFSWGLYSDASTTDVQYTARLIAIDGRPLDAPVDLDELPEFHRGPDYWRDAGVVASFGEALDAGDAAETRALRKLFEANVLTAARARYEMVKRTYAPLERRASGTFTETTLGVFDKNDADGETP